MNIYINISENSGVGYYRQYLPAVALRKAGHNVLINDFTWGESRLFCKLFHPGCEHIVFGYDAVPMIDEFAKHLTEVHGDTIGPVERQKIQDSITGMVEPAVEMLNKIGHWADVIHFGRRDVPEYLSQWGGLRDFFNVPIIMDTDDNVFATRPFNPGYRGYYPGSQAFYWNRKTAQEVDAITVSTENLKQVHLKDNQNIFVLPNSLEMDKWDGDKPEHPEIRIGLLMSSSHHEDVKLLEKVIPVILKKYPNVHFYYTNMYSYIFEPMEEADRLHQIPWIPLKTWPETVVAQGFDIGLAPLVDNLFNRAKSNLRFLEYSAARMATVASPVEPYKCIQPNKTGLIASSTDEWIAQISRLIEDETLRKQIATNANNYVRKNFNSETNAKHWVKVYNSVIKNYRKKKGPRKTFQVPSDYFPTSSIA